MNRTPYREHGCFQGGCLGALIGGVLIPVALAICAAIALNDAGGPLFWPILIFLGAVIGLFIGALTATILQHQQQKSSANPSEKK